MRNRITGGMLESADLTALAIALLEPQKGLEVWSTATVQLSGTTRRIAYALAILCPRNHDALFPVMPGATNAKFL
jgi:hypothetical protein